MNIYVGNLAFGVTEEKLRSKFAAYGTVTTVNIIKDRYTGQPRGFAFVEMPSKSEGEAAIAGLVGESIDGRILNINEARPRTDNRNREFSIDRHGDGYNGRQRRDGGFGRDRDGGRNRDKRFGDRMQHR
jgi:RNA recognition motif-containing protein